MELNIFRILGILGLIFIIFGTLSGENKLKKKRRFLYPFLILGGLLLIAHSFYFKDTVFIILQSIFVIIAIIGFIKVNENYIQMIERQAELELKKLKKGRL
jgi:lipid-A-disaccharide synthase-like uncharacterized protein